MLGYALAIFALGCLGGVVPLFARRTERVLHLLIALSTGIFLGVVFQHLLPEVAALAAAEDAAAHAHAEPGGGHDHGHDHGGEDAGHDHGSEDDHAHEEDVHESQDHGEHGHADHGHDDHGHHDHAHEQGGHGHSHSALWLWMLGGLLGLYFLEHLVFGGAHVHAHSHAHHLEGEPEERHNQHVTLGWAALLGLSVHAFTAGITLSATYLGTSMGAVVFFCIIAHKAAETFSLGTVFLLGGFSVKATLGVVLGFSLVTPLGMLVGAQLFANLPTYAVHVLVALSAGTFLFVALCDLLPEVFHDRKDVLARVSLLVVGVVISVLVHAGSGV